MGEDAGRELANTARVEGISFRGEERPIVLQATVEGAIGVFTLEGGEYRRLASIPGEADAPRALCAWRPPQEQILYTYLADREGGIAQQLMLFDQQDGGDEPAVVAHPVRTLRVPGPVTACAVDRRRGQLYVAVEGEGVRRFHAAPPERGTMGFSARELAQQVAAIADPGAIGGELILTVDELGGTAGLLSIEERGEESFLLVLIARARPDGSFAPPVFLLPGMETVPAEALDGSRPAE